MPLPGHPPSASSTCHASSLYAAGLVEGSLGGSSSAGAEGKASSSRAADGSSSSALLNGEASMMTAAAPSPFAPTASLSVFCEASQNAVETAPQLTVADWSGGRSAQASSATLQPPASNSASAAVQSAAGRRRGRSPGRALPPSSSPVAGAFHQPLQREIVLMHRLTQEQFQQRLADVRRYRRTLQVINFRNTVFPSAYSAALFLSAAEKAPQLTKVLMYYFDSLPPAQYRVFCYGLARCRHIRHVDANATGASGLSAWRTLLLLNRLKTFPDIRHVTLSGNELESFRGGRRRFPPASKAAGELSRASSDSEDLDEEERQEEESEWARDSDYAVADEAEDADGKTREDKRDKASEQEIDVCSAQNAHQSKDKRQASRAPGTGKAEIKRSRTVPGERGKGTQKKPPVELASGDDTELPTKTKLVEHTASEACLDRASSSVEESEVTNSRDVDEDLEVAAKQLLAQVLADVRAGRRAVRRRRHFPRTDEKSEHCSIPTRLDERETSSLSPAVSFIGEENETRAVYALRDLMVGGVVCLQIKECALAQQSQLSVWVLNSCHLLRLRQFDLGKGDRSLALVLPDEKDPPTNDELLRRICRMSRQLWTQRKQSSDILTPFHAVDDWQETMLPYFWLYALLDCMLLYAHNHPSSSVTPSSSSGPSLPGSDKSGESRLSSRGDGPSLPFAGASYASKLKYPHLLRQPLVRVWMPPQEPLQGSGTTLKLPPGSSAFCYALLVGRVGDRCLVRWLSRRQFSEYLEKDQLACKESLAFPFHGRDASTSSSTRATNGSPSSASSASSDLAAVFSRYTALNPFPPLCPVCVPLSSSSSCPSSDGSFAPGVSAGGAHQSQVPRGRTSSRLAAVAAAGALHGAASASSLYSGGPENSPQMRRKRELESFFGRFDAAVPVSRVEPAAFAWDWIQGPSEEKPDAEDARDERQGAEGSSFDREELVTSANRSSSTPLKSKDGAKDDPEGRERGDMPPIKTEFVGKEGSDKRDDKRQRGVAKGGEERKSEEGIGVGSWVEVDVGGEEDASKPFVTAIGVVCQIDQAPVGTPPLTLPPWQAPSCAFNPQVGLAVAASRYSSCGRSTSGAHRSLLTGRLRISLLHTKPAQTGAAPSQVGKGASSRTTANPVGKHAASGGGGKGCDAGRLVTVSFNRVRPLQVLMAPKDAWTLSAVRQQIAKVKDDAEQHGAEKRIWGFGGALGSCVLLPKEWGIDAAERDFGASRAFPVALSHSSKASGQSCPETPPAAPLVLHSKLLHLLEADRLEFVQKAMQHPRQLIVHFGLGTPSVPASSPSSAIHSRRGHGGSSQRGGGSGASAACGPSSAASRTSSETSQEASPRLGSSTADKGSTDSSQTSSLSTGVGVNPNSGLMASGAATVICAARGESSQAGEERKGTASTVGGHHGNTVSAGWNAHMKHLSHDTIPGFRRLDYTPFLSPPSPQAGFFTLLDGRGGAIQSHTGQGKARAEVPASLSSEKTSGEGADRKTQGQSLQGVDSGSASQAASQCPSVGEGASAGRSASSRRPSSPQQYEVFDPDSACRQDSLFAACNGSAAEAPPPDRKSGPPSFGAPGPGTSPQGVSSAGQKKRSTGGTSKEAKGGLGGSKTTASSQGGKAAQNKRSRLAYSPTTAGKARSVGSDKSMSPPPFRLDRERSPSPIDGATCSLRSQQVVFLGGSLSDAMQIDSCAAADASVFPSCSTSVLQRGLSRSGERSAVSSVAARSEAWVPCSKDRGGSRLAGAKVGEKSGKGAKRGREAKAERPGSPRARSLDSSGANLVLCVVISDDETAGRKKLFTGESDRKAKPGPELGLELSRQGTQGKTRGGDISASSGCLPTQVMARGPLAGRFHLAAGEGEEARTTRTIPGRRRRTHLETAEGKRRKIDEVRREQDADEAQLLWRLSLPCPVLSPREEEGEVRLSGIDIGEEGSRTELYALDQAIRHTSAEGSSQVSRHAIVQDASSTSTSRESSPASSRSCSPPASPVAVSCGAHAPFTLHLSRGTPESFTKDCLSSPVLAENPLLPPARQPLAAAEWQLIKNALHLLRGRGVCGLICEAGGPRLSPRVQEETEQHICLPLTADVWHVDEDRSDSVHSATATNGVARDCIMGGEGVSSNSLQARPEGEGSVLSENRRPSNDRRSGAEEAMARSEELPRERPARPCFWRLNDDSLNQLRCFLEFSVSRRQFRMLQEEHFSSCPAAVKRRPSQHTPGQQSPLFSCSSHDAAGIPQNPSTSSEGDALPSSRELGERTNGNGAVFPRSSSAASVSPQGEAMLNGSACRAPENRGGLRQESATCICLDCCTCCVSDRASQRHESSDILGPLLVAVSPRPPVASRRDKSKSSRFSGERPPPPESAPARAAVMRSSRAGTETASGVPGLESGVSGTETAGGDTSLGTGFSGGPTGNPGGGAVSREGSSTTATAEGTATSGAGKKRGRGKGNAGTGGHSHGWKSSWDRVGGVSGEYRSDTQDIYRRYAEAILEQQARRRRRQLKCDGRLGSFGWRRDQFLRQLREGGIRDDVTDAEAVEGEHEEPHETDGVSYLGESVEDRLYRVMCHLAESGDLWGTHRGRENRRFGVAPGSSDPTASGAGGDPSASYFVGRRDMRRPWESAEVGLFVSGDDMSGLDTEKDEEDPTVQRRLRRERRAAANEAAAAAAATEDGPPGSGAGGSVSARGGSVPSPQDHSRQNRSSSATAGGTAKKIPTSNRRVGKSRKASGSPSETPLPTVNLPPIASLSEAYAAEQPCPVHLEEVMDAAIPSVDGDGSRRREDLLTSSGSPNAPPLGAESCRARQGRESQQQGVCGPSSASFTSSDQACAQQGVHRRPSREPVHLGTSSGIPGSASQAGAPSGSQASDGWSTRTNKRTTGDGDRQAEQDGFLTSPEVEAATQDPQIPSEALGRASQATSDNAFSSDSESSVSTGGPAAASEGGSISETVDVSSPAAVGSPRTDGEGNGESQGPRTEVPCVWKPANSCGKGTREPLEAGSLSGDQNSLSPEHRSSRELRTQETPPRESVQPTAAQSSSRREHDGSRQGARRDLSPAAGVAPPHVRVSSSSPRSVGREGNGADSATGHRASTPARRTQLYESRLHGSGSPVGSRSGHASPRRQATAGGTQHAKLGKGATGAVDHAITLGSLQLQLQHVQHQQHQLAKYREQFQQHIAQQQLVHLRQWVRHPAAPAYYAVHGFPRHGPVFATQAAFGSGGGGGWGAGGASLHYSPVQVLQCVSDSAPALASTRCVPRSQAGPELVGVHATTPLPADAGPLTVAVADVRASAVPTVRKIELRPVQAPEGPCPPGALGSAAASPVGVSKAVSVIDQRSSLGRERDPRGMENEMSPAFAEVGRRAAAGMNGTHGTAALDGERLPERGYAVEQVIDLTEDE
ncbi:conserved hypothetical protein [Neospora caninum Liverpool]|uniref:Uncharacterized protein n=1 Tax=Neospora caninum (strain Liverpool) TaxID=572307 RepID=F0VE31_NEOCL|nr:conserved hypothetical protein [Neospora caninum Liverpool]CBZ51974.1 conserved hypothetical protein [Neospora caninum Liverpool]CEL65935.1 TPA: hypothetical protein BN1204_017660 [Neospora caninum Liverpool]|eukprot:XP_003882007.1 conserved hypothetical protein [Neospora caninum Liverpool]